MTLTKLSFGSYFLYLLSYIFFLFKSVQIYGFSYGVDGVIYIFYLFSAPLGFLVAAYFLFKFLGFLNYKKIALNFFLFVNFVGFMASLLAAFIL